MIGLRRILTQHDFYNFLFFVCKMTQPAYKYSDHYNATFKTVRDLNSTLRNDLLPKTGGVVTGPVYLNSAVETNEFATK